MLLALGLVLLLAVPAAAIALLEAAAPVPARGSPGDQWSLAELRGEAVAGLEFRENDPLAISVLPAGELSPVSQARLHFETSARSAILQFFHVGPESVKTVGNMELRGIPVSAPVCIGRISVGGTRLVAIGNWPTGLYFAQLTASGGRVGYAPFVVPPKRLGQNRVAIVLPTRTWQAYNFRDDTAMASATRGTRPSFHTARLYRPFLSRGVPPHFRNYDLHFLHWLSRSGKRVDILSQAELEAVRDRRRSAVRTTCSSFPGTTST